LQPSTRRRYPSSKKIVEVLRAASEVSRALRCTGSRPPCLVPVPIDGSPPLPTAHQAYCARHAVMSGNFDSSPGFARTQSSRQQSQARAERLSRLALRPDTRLHHDRSAVGCFETKTSNEAPPQTDEACGWSGSSRRFMTSSGKPGSIGPHGSKRLQEANLHDRSREHDSTKRGHYPQRSSSRSRGSTECTSTSMCLGCRPN
jgi:hypothetical protein